MTTRLLELKGLVKRYGGLVATNNLNLQIYTGETHAIIGPNGAGKTTIIHQIAGSLQPNEGNILFNGSDVTSEPTHKRVALGLARSYQITNVFRSYTVLDNLALAVQARSGSSLRFWKAAIHESAIFDEAEKLAHRIGCPGALATWRATLLMASSVSLRWASPLPQDLSYSFWTSPWRAWGRRSPPPWFP